MKRPMLIVVRDTAGAEWAFPFRGDPADLADWRSAGLQVEVLEATIPGWAVGTPAAGLIAAVQAAWQWARLW